MFRTLRPQRRSSRDPHARLASSFLADCDIVRILEEAKKILARVLKASMACLSMRSASLSALHSVLYAAGISSLVTLAFKQRL
jgi:hypothetical protein